MNTHPNRKNRHSKSRAQTLSHLHGDAVRVTQGERHPAPERGTHHARLEEAMKTLPAAAYGAAGWTTLSALKRQGLDPDQIGEAFGRGVRADNPFGDHPLRLYPETLVRELFGAREQAHPWADHTHVHAFGPVDGPGWITMASVRRRGWSSDQIHGLLGGGERRPNPMQGPDLRLYPVTWVEECEYSRNFRFEINTDDFKTTGSARRRAQELKASRNSALARLLAGDFVATDLRTHLSVREGRYQIRGHTSVDSRIMANHLRHRTTPYEQVCSGSGEQFRGASWRNELSREDYVRVNQIVCSALTLLYDDAGLREQFSRRLEQVGAALLTAHQLPGDVGAQLRGQVFAPKSRANL